MAPSTVSAEAFAAEGTLMEYLHPDYGVQIYRYLRNHSGSDLAVGLAVDFETDSQVDVELAAAIAHRANVGGITQNTVPAGNFFWGLVRGKGLGKADAAGATIGALLKCAANGELDETAAALGSQVVARALATIAGGAVGLVEVSVFGG
tara:strand:+ start:145 stop:591 length:447 start_codon:yes stop_codon:yes gene_type:complete